MRRILLICVIVIALVLAACAAGLPPTPTPDPAPEPTPDPEPDPAPASFTISDLSVDPAEIYAGEQITVSVVVRNVGELAGDYRIAFSIRNVTVETVDIHLASGDAEQVDVTVMVDYGAGAYSVDVNGLRGLLTVKEPPASLHLSDLTTNSIAFSIAIDGDLSPHQIEYSISGNGYGMAETLGDHAGSTIIIDNLEEDTVYTLQVSRIEGDLLLDRIVFRTFREINNGLQLYYLIDARAPCDHILGVQIFGNIRNVRPITFEHKGYHFHVLNIADGSLDVSANSYHADEAERKVTVYSDSRQEHFRISYQVDKSVADTPIVVDEQWTVYYGFVDCHYLLTAGETLMLLPPGYMGDSDQWWIYEYDTFELYGYLNHPMHWEPMIGFDMEDGLIDFLSHLPEGRGIGIRAANIYAYDRHAFEKRTECIAGTDVHVILQDTIDDRYFGDIFSVYTRLCGIWGGGFGGDNYSIMIVDDSEHWIYAGEWTTGQGLSTLYVNDRILDGLLVHQMYHCWNAWKLGIGFSEEQEFTDNPGNMVRSFWVEGWNNFYCDKVLTELGFMDYDLMKAYYSMYEVLRNTSQDVPMLEYRHGIDHIWIHEAKGPLLAYLLDQEIRTQSESAYSLDDVLKYEWERWSVGGHHSSYHIIVDFIRDVLGVHTIDAWWQKYVVESEPLHRQDFAFLAP